MTLSFLNLFCKTPKYTSLGKRPDLSVPSFIDSFDSLKSRNLQISWGKGKKSEEVYFSLLDSFNRFIRYKYPGWQVVVLVNIYEELPHGQVIPQMWQIVSLKNNLHEIKKTVIRNTKEKGKFWSGGYSDIVLIAPIENYCFNENILPNIPYDVRLTMYIPMFDFDLIASGDPRKDLEEPVLLLAKNGFSGWLIQSGDEKKGSYHFLSNLLFPHDSSYWKIKAKLMKIMTPNKPFFRYLLEFAERLEKTNNWEDARKVAREILYSDKGIPSNFKTGSYIDYRFMAHSIEQRIGVLRSIKSYKYRSLPTVVGEIK